MPPTSTQAQLTRQHSDVAYTAGSQAQRAQRPARRRRPSGPVRVPQNSNAPGRSAAMLPDAGATVRNGTVATLTKRR
jgi:hypothetical protein